MGAYEYRILNVENAGKMKGTQACRGSINGESNDQLKAHQAVWIAGPCNGHADDQVEAAGEGDRRHGVSGDSVSLSSMIDT